MYLENASYILMPSWEYHGFDLKSSHGVIWSIIQLAIIMQWCLVGQASHVETEMNNA